MFIIPCPYCGRRDQSEFSCGGEAHISRPEAPDELSDAQWADFVFMRTNPKGVYYERWVHAAGCRRWFNMVRNTATDEILAVYEMGEAPPDVEARLPRTPAGEARIGSGNDAVKLVGPDEIATGQPATPEAGTDADEQSRETAREARG